jgi:hypothetical protein
MKFNLLLIMVLIVPAAASAEATQTPTIDQSVSLRSVSTPRMSPDGRLVAYRRRSRTLRMQKPRH